MRDNITIYDKIDPESAKQILKANNNKLVDNTSEAYVKLDGISKVYPNGVKAVHEFQLEIMPHEFVALVGPSGCGKSTTLRMVAGLEEISMGSLFINGVYSNYLASKDRDIAMVFQSYALYPQKTVYDNIAFGLKIRHVDKNEIEKRVMEVAKILDLGQYLDRYPRELSGGQMQRVALGRAIVRQAGLFLMDEPLSNLDAKLRVQMRSEIVRIHKEVGATTIYVTHDQTEAMTMANKIVIMNKGFVQQIGKPIDVYKHPNNLFVATFIGSPSMNIIQAKYFNGKIVFPGGLSFEASNEFKKRRFDFYLKRSKELKNILDNFDTFGPEEMARINSSQIFVKGDKVVKVEKKEHFKFIKKLFSKNNNKKELEHKQMLEKITSMYENAQKALEGSQPIVIGIRPENIYLADDFRGKAASDAFLVTSNLVELLGSEYIVHADAFNTTIRIKIDGNKVLDDNKSLNLKLDTDKVLVYDVDSGFVI